MTVRISAIVTVHDREALVPRVVESALAAGPDELIVVDDGSTDGSWDAISAHGDRVVAHRQDNRGPAAARNAGVQRARWPWIAFLDSDDLWDPGHLDRMRAAISTTDGGAGLYFADTVLAPSRGSTSLWEVAGFSADADVVYVEDGTEVVLRARQPTMLQASVLSKALYVELGGLSERLRVREDTHLFFRLGFGRPVCAVRGVGARMTDDGGAARLTEQSWTDTPEYWWATRTLYEDLLSGDDGLSADTRRELRRRLASAYLRLARADRRLVPRALLLTRALLTSPSRVREAVARRVGR